MKAAVFSDTHGVTSLMLETARRCRPDVMIHLGDHERDAERLREEFPEIPLYCVRGNCDIGGRAPDTDIVPLGPVKAFITHGHLFNVKYGRLDSLVYAAMEQGARIAMFGHTHEADYEEIGGVKVINPGTAGAGRRLTWALVEVFDNGGIPRDEMKAFVLLLCPFAPHLAEELWELLGGEGFASLQPYPTYDASLLVSDTVELAVQVCGKFKGTVTVPAAASEDEVWAAIESAGLLTGALAGKTVVKRIYVPGRIFNVVAK